MKNTNTETTRNDLIRQLYNSYHEGEAELPDTDVAKSYIYDEGTGTLYCRETDRNYKTTEFDEAIDYFAGVTVSIENSLSTSADPYKQKKKIEYCKIAAEAIEYMRKHLEIETKNAKK